MATNVAAIDDRTTRGTNKALHIALWVAQVLLAAAFGMAGFMKLTAPLATLMQKMPWTAAVPGTLVRFIGACELAAALGLLLPSLTRIRPRLTPLAAAGLVTIMVLAIGFHLSRGEAPVVKFNIALGAVAAFIAWGRTRKAPIPARERA